MMNMEDGDGLNICEGDNGARADGDSSLVTHRPFPLQLHIGKHVETATFYVTDLCHGFILGYSWLERHNPTINWVISDVTISNPVELSPISCSLSDSISLESMQSDVYPFVEIKPKHFRHIETLTARSISSLVVSLFMARSTSLTREEDKVMQEWIQDNLRKGFIRIVRLHMAHLASLSSRRTNSDSYGLSRSNKIQLRIGTLYRSSELLRTCPLEDLHYMDFAVLNLLRIKEETSPRLLSSRSTAV
ncbi:hypothetical protein BASA83_011564 [Batrachochytrium salamandrivorans]|nr:hypothetical protein BASA83_011564 [Batrachochytrium salamandrivorans]